MRTVEGMDSDAHLGRRTPVGARAQPVANDLLEPADGRLGSSPFGVAGGFLPGCASVRSNALQMAVALRGRSCSRSYGGGQQPVVG